MSNEQHFYDRLMSLQKAKQVVCVYIMSSDEKELVQKNKHAIQPDIDRFSLNFQPVVYFKNQRTRVLSLFKIIPNLLRYPKNLEVKSLI